MSTQVCYKNKLKMFQHVKAACPGRTVHIRNNNGDKNQPSSESDCNSSQSSPQRTSSNVNASMPPATNRMQPLNGRPKIPNVPTTLPQFDQIGPTIHQTSDKKLKKELDSSKYEFSPRRPLNPRTQEPILMTSMAQLQTQLARQSENDFILNGVPYRLNFQNGSPLSQTRPLSDARIADIPILTEDPPDEQNHQSPPNLLGDRESLSQTVTDSLIAHRNSGDHHGRAPEQRFCSPPRTIAVGQPSIEERKTAALCSVRFRVDQNEDLRPTTILQQKYSTDSSKREGDRSIVTPPQADEIKNDDSRPPEEEKKDGPVVQAALQTASLAPARQTAKPRKIKRRIQIKDVTKGKGKTAQPLNQTPETKSIKSLALMNKTPIQMNFHPGDEALINRLGCALKKKVKQKLTYRNITLEDLKASKFQRQLTRSNSQDKLIKVYVRNRLQIFTENQMLRKRRQFQNLEESTKIQIAFLHASPLVYEDKMSVKKIPQLNFLKEENAIKYAIKRSGHQVNYEKAVATKENFAELMRQDPFIMHLSCHGFDASHKANNLTNFLLFEDNLGQAEYIPEQSLKKLLTREGTCKIKVIFIAACMSEFVVPLFRECKVSHIICVQKGKEILDSVAIQFTKSFYTGIVNGKNVCEAFQNAKDDVSFQENSKESAILKLHLLETQWYDEKTKKMIDHTKETCQTRSPFNSGKFKCHSNHIQVKDMPSKQQTFCERDQRMASLVRKLLEKVNGDQVLHLIGLPGIGKSVLARNAVHYLKERKYFSSGILFIQLDMVTSVHVLLHIIMSHLTDQLSLDDSQEKALLNRTRTSPEQFIVKFFNRDFQGHQLRKEKTLKEIKDTEGKNFLLCLDNCSSMISEDNKGFQALLKRLQDQCPNLKIIVTSRQDMFDMRGESSIASFKTQPFYLEQLEPEQTVRLFLSQSTKTIAVKEVVDLIASQSDDYPLEKIKSFKKNQPEMQKKDIEKNLNDAFKNLPMENEDIVDALAKTQLFKQLAGNPLSICMVAKCYDYGPVNKQDSLTKLWQLVKRQQQERSAYDKHFQHMNNVSLENSIGLTIDMLRPSSIKVLTYLSFMSGGATTYQLEKITEIYLEQVKEEVETLINLGLLTFDKVTKRYHLASNLLKDYIHSVVPHAPPIKAIGKYYLEGMKIMYRLYGHPDQKAELENLDADWLQTHPLLKNLKEKSFVRRESKTDQASLKKPLSSRKRIQDDQSNIQHQTRHADFQNISFAVSQISIKLMRQRMEQQLVIEKQKQTVNGERLDGLLNAIEEMEGTDRSDPIRDDELSFPSSRVQKRMTVKAAQESTQNQLPGLSMQKHASHQPKLTGRETMINRLSKCIGEQLLKNQKDLFDQIQTRQEELQTKPVLEFGEIISGNKKAIKMAANSVLINQTQQSASAQQQTRSSTKTDGGDFDRYIKKLDSILKDCKNAADDFNFSKLQAKKICQQRSSVKKLAEAVIEYEESEESVESEESSEDENQNRVRVVQKKDSKMTDEMEFILLFQAIQVLATSVQNEEVKFEEIIENLNEEESLFFFGNMYRVQALLAEQNLNQRLERQKKEEKCILDENEDKENKRLLSKAIEEATKSFDVFNKIDEVEYKSAIYGRALANYLLGHLWFNHACRLDKINSNNDGGNDSLNKAKLAMVHTAKQFDEVHHYKGCQLAYEQLAKMYEGDDEYQQERLEFLTKQAKFKTMYETQGYKICRFIPRNGLDEMSLLTEIVRFDTSSCIRAYSKKMTQLLLPSKFSNMQAGNPVALQKLKSD